MTQKTLQNAYRDPVSGAIINMDRDQYQAALIRKRLSREQERKDKEISTLQERIEDMECDLNSVNSKLDSILQLLQKSD